MSRIGAVGIAVCSAVAITTGLVAGSRGTGYGDAPLRNLAQTSSVTRSTTDEPGPGLVTDDPLAGEQWYLARSRVFDAWPELPPLAPVKVAVIDTGIDLAHPEFKGRIVEARTFVRGSPQDTRGHGTIIAGLIAANLDNGLGIAGAAPSASLLVAKVVRADESVSVVAEAQAIRWAVDQGARVISISLSGLRSPHNADEDSFSILEADAVEYAVAHDVLVVASVGNGDLSPTEPWQYAAYPAALPHVVGVSAIGLHGNVPLFSNRDTRYNDLAAPGVEMISTFPLQLSRRGCKNRGYTPCATPNLTHPEGTSFSAPLVAAVAANLLARRPSLTASQVSVLLERTTADSKPASGCGLCTPGRDSLSGWGELDGAAALAALNGPLPAPDALEPNDEPGSGAAKLFFPPGSASRSVRATLDFWDDSQDVYRVRLERGETVFASLSSSGAAATLALWAPDTLAFERPERPLTSSAGPGARERVTWTAEEAGWYVIQVRVDAKVGPVPTVLSLVRR